MNKAEQMVAEPKKSATLTRWRHGKRASSKVLATEPRGLGWRSHQGGESMATITVANQEAAEAYTVELNHAALKELVEMFDRHQIEENKIGRGTNEHAS